MARSNSISFCCVRENVVTSLLSGKLASPSLPTKILVDEKLNQSIYPTLEDCLALSANAEMLDPDQN